MAGFKRPMIGELREAITLEKRALTQDGAVDFTTANTAKASAVAKVETLGGGSYMAGAQVEERITHVFTIRFRKDFRADATRWNGLSWDGRRFRVREIMDPGTGRDRKRWLQIRAEEERTV